MSNRVFGLSNPEKLILKGLAKNGPSNKNQIFSFISKSSDKVSYEKFHNLLYGSTKDPGLVRTRYIFEVLENKKRSGHTESTLYLTPKGVIASITNQPLQKNVFFNMYFENTEKIIDINPHQIFFREFIESQINIFLTYHAIQGINLKKHVSFESYYLDFVNRIDSHMDILFSNNEEKEFFLKTIKRFFIMHNCFVYLTMECIEVINNFPSLFYYKGDLRFESKKPLWTSYILKWASTFDQTLLNEDEQRVRKINLEFIREKFYESNYPWIKHIDEIVKKIKKMGVKISVKKIPKKRV